MLFGALGDIHGDFSSARRIMERHPEVPFWVCVGDVADANGRYEGLPATLYWIKGNNENFDLIEADELPPTLRYIRNGVLLEVLGIRLAGLGGTLAPTWYETPAAALPHPTKGRAEATEHSSRVKVRDDKRRHFVREEVTACAAMRAVDLFMTHEAPRPYRVGRLDAGKAPVNEVLAAMRPRLHLFGHHHRFSEQEREGVRSVGLDLVSRSYLLIRRETMEYHIHTL
jgi:predicted phosphodiesterase